MNWLALDIGGANIKAADGKSFAASYPFALWRRPAELSHELRRIISEAPVSDHLVATMTGELADCFSSKHEGVEFICKAFLEAADGRHARVYTKDGMFVTPQVATRRYDQAAAANWHALARFAGRFLELGPSLLLDVGSTTCDVIYFHDGLPIHSGYNDTKRLISGELVYTGVHRSPLCAVVSSVPYRDHLCPTAHELFATMIDAYVILESIAENSTDKQTADGRPATKSFARVRLGRSICADTEQFNHRDAVAVAQAAASAQAELLANAATRILQRHGSTPRSVLISGQGDFLARAALEQVLPDAAIISLATQLGHVVSRCATAHALAIIANESAGR